MVMGRRPQIIYDSAHNEGGIRELTSQLKKLSFKNLHFVYGTVGDKDIIKILSLLPKKATYYFCKPDIPRGKDVTELHIEATAQKLKGTAYPSVAKAYKAALTQADRGDYGARQW
jgi:dihydrofolate synthase/folylpolyglutamate synthase